jgi:hypothetical protein
MSVSFMYMRSAFAEVLLSMEWNVIGYRWVFLQHKWAVVTQCLCDCKMWLPPDSRSLLLYPKVEVDTVVLFFACLRRSSKLCEHRWDWSFQKCFCRIFTRETIISCRSLACPTCRCTKLPPHCSNDPDSCWQKLKIICTTFVHKVLILLGNSGKKCFFLQTVLNKVHKSTNAFIMISWF